MQQLHNHNNFLASSIRVKYSLLHVLHNRLSHYTYIVRGKDAGREAWHYVFIDWDKKEEFLERSRTGAMDVANYGKVFKSGWGHDVSQDIRDQVREFEINFLKYFFVKQLQTEGQWKIYYVMADFDRELEIEIAFSEEELRNFGKILYSSSDEDPAEVLSDIIEDKYFGVERRIFVNLNSMPFNAIRNGEIQIIQDYLEAGRDINCVDEKGWTMLHHAAHFGNMDIVSLLINSGADINLQDKVCGRKPVHIAARESHNHVIELFLRSGSTVNEVDKKRWTLAHYAVWRGNAETVRFLIENNADINAREITSDKKLVHIAAEYGHTHIIAFLLDTGVNIEDGDQFGRTPFYYAAMTGAVETARFLIGKGADINKETTFNTKPMHAAAFLTNAEMIDLLFSHGASINEGNIDEKTPLHYAALLGNFELVQFLVDNDANISAVDIDGKTPFDLGKQHIDIALYLANRMGEKYESQENYSEALKVYRDLLKVQQGKLGLDHPETLETHNKVATVLYKHGQYDEAVTTFVDVLEKRENNLGPLHVDTWRTMHGLGLVYTAQAKYDEAMEILREVLTKRETNLGVGHRDTLTVARDIGFLHFKQREYNEAFEIFQHVFETRQELLGNDHPETVQVGEDMAMVLESRRGEVNHYLGT